MLVLINNKITTVYAILENNTQNCVYYYESNSYIADINVSIAYDLRNGYKLIYKTKINHLNYRWVYQNKLLVFNQNKLLVFNQNLFNIL